MKFSYRLLSHYVNLSGLTPDEVANRLTFSGFEVEGKERLAEASSLVIGKILEESKHPDSDHLHLLKVDCGPEGILDIVCGAPNARKGIKVIVALPGCVLPALGETIRVGTIRGKESCGMCCSLAELGVDKSLLSEKQLAGIEELPEEAPVGERDVLGYLGLDDVILDINVLPNRPDCLSIFGLARELSSLLGRELIHFPKPVDVPSSSIVVESLTPSCPRFDILSLRHIVSKKETPLSFRRALESAGIRALNPIVDLGNYVMLLTGQPVNLYDASAVKGGRYVVREDLEGKFTLFSGKEVDLAKGDLVVTDGSTSLCLAGIEAGKVGMVTDRTTDVDVELACFYHKNIRHTSSRLGLSSYSSQLFAKERNPRMIKEAIDTLLSLLPEFFESYEVLGYSSYNSLVGKDRSFPFSLERLNHRLGSDFTMDEVDHVLQAYRIRREGEMLYPPIDRTDLKEQCDIDEEVFRYYPAEMIKPSLSSFPISLGGRTRGQKMVSRLEELLKDRGYLETLTYTLVGEKEDRKIHVFADVTPYKVLNPMTKDHELVRTDLLPSLLLAMERNRAKQKNDLKFFEISPIDTPKGNHLYLAMAESGMSYRQDRAKPELASFLSMKGTIVTVLEELGFAEGRYQLLPSKNPAFNPMSSADVYLGKRLAGTFGNLTPKIDRMEAVVGELDLGLLLEQGTARTKAKSYPMFAPVRRDFSLVLDHEVRYQDIRRLLLHLNGTHIVDVRLFDLFQDEKDRYLGLSLYLSCEEKSLTEKEINDDLDKAKSVLREKLSLSVRGEKNA